MVGLSFLRGGYEGRQLKMRYSIHQSKPRAVTAENYNLTQVVRNISRTSYYTVIPLDQARPAVTVRDNMEDRAFVAIKRDLMYRIPGFTSDHLINTKDVFLEGDDDVVILYGQM